MTVFLLLLVTLFAGLASVVAVLALIVAMARAERQARRSLLRALGLSDETVELLMSRNGDVRAEISLLRASAATRGEPGAGESNTLSTEMENASFPAQPTIPKAAGDREVRNTGETRRGSRPGRNRGL